jgi:prephenate dehydrogenase
LIDRISKSLEDAASEADLIVLATPVGAIPPLARSLVPYLPSGVIVTDVGSVKRPILMDLDRVLPPHAHFVASHPIAGTEHWGAKAAFPTLFEGQRCILTPSPQTSSEALKKMIRLWRGVGSRVEVMEARLHDRVMGNVSHLPHMIAYALVNSVAGARMTFPPGDAASGAARSPDFLSYCGGGFRDFTRIASSRPEMWRDICLMNRTEILAGIARFEKTLRRIRTMIERRRGKALEEEFLKANKARERMLV